MQMDNYCRECQRPVYSFYKVCVPCKRRFIKNGYQDKRVTFGEVGRAMIPHQQSLHTKFFDCNAPVAYRGKREERIYYKIDQRIVNSQSRVLHSYLFELNNKHGYLYRKISSTPNISKRLLYNATLFFLHYVYIKENQLFNTHLHLQASIVNMILIQIENTYLRIFKDSKEQLSFIHQQRVSYKRSVYTKLYNQIEECSDRIIDGLNSEYM